MILICSDSFKDSVSALSVCSAIERGLMRADVQMPLVPFPMSDGGDGLDAVLKYHLDVESVEVDTVDPLGRPINTYILFLPEQKAAYFAMAQSAGLELLSHDERNPLHTSTAGVGYMLGHCKAMGARKAYVGLGGSATHDIGSGMAQQLGWTFEDHNGRPLKMNGEALGAVANVMPPTSMLTDGLQINFLTDVDNFLLGKHGAAMTYAAQKGGTVEVCHQLETDTRSFCSVVLETLDLDMNALPGGGAAGGLGAGGSAFVNARLMRGVDAMCHLTRIDDQLDHAKLVITGEGKLDAQTAHGKLIKGVVTRAKARNLPVVVFCGQNQMEEEQWRNVGIDLVIEISSGITDMNYSIAHASDLLEKCAYEASSEILALT